MLRFMSISIGKTDITKHKRVIIMKALLDSSWVMGMAMKAELIMLLLLKYIVRGYSCCFREVCGTGGEFFRTITIS